MLVILKIFAEDTKKSITELGDFLNFIPDSDLKREFKFKYNNALKNINNVLKCKNSLIKNLKKIDSKENEF